MTLRKKTMSSTHMHKDICTKTFFAALSVMVGKKNWPEGESVNCLRGQSNVSAATYRWGAPICTDTET